MSQKHKIRRFCCKISTWMLPGQHLEEITHFFDQFNAWKILWKYRDILHHIEISWNIVCIVKKRYCSRVVSTISLNYPKCTGCFFTSFAQHYPSIKTLCTNNDEEMAWILRWGFKIKSRPNDSAIANLTGFGHTLP